MITIVLSYQGNEAQSDRLVQQLKEHNFPNIMVVNPLPRCDKINIPASKIIFYTFKKYIIPILQGHMDDAIFFEDDAVVKSDYTMFLQHSQRGLLSRLSWYRKQNKNFIAGTTCIGINRKIIHKLNIALHNARAQHFDRFLTIFGLSLDEGEHYVAERKERLCGTTTHYSPITGKERKGYTTSL